jgi:hypothetical protein
LRRCPIDTTPSPFRSSAVRSPKASRWMSFSRNACSYRQPQIAQPSANVHGLSRRRRVRKAGSFTLSQNSAEQDAKNVARQGVGPRVIPVPAPCGTHRKSSGFFGPISRIPDRINDEVHDDVRERPGPITDFRRAAPRQK